MTRGPIEVDVLMGGSVIQLISRVSPTIIQLAKVGYMPLTLTLILNPTNPRHSILRINCDYLPDVIEDLNTLYFLDALLPERPCGDGFAIED